MNHRVLKPALFTSNGPAAVTAAAISAAALVLWISLPVIDHAPLYDELLHYLAAQDLESGRPAIAGGEYTRALLFTKLVAVSLSGFGNTLIAARIPALLAAMLLAALATGWVTRRAGVLAGVASGLALCMVPDTVELAVFARFYTVHALLICLFAIFVYEGLQPERPAPMRILLIALALALLPLAWHFQSTTLIAAGAVLSGAAAVCLFDYWGPVKAFVASRTLSVAAGCCAAIALAVLLFWKLDIAARMGEVPIWAAWAADRPHHYLIDLAQRLPLLWPLFPLAAVLAVKTHRRLTLFCVVTVLAALLVHSIAAAKSTRYIYYLLPLLSAVWGCALVTCWRQLLQMTQSRGVQVLSVALIGVILALSQEGQRLARLVLRTASPVEVLSYGTEPDWHEALPALRAAASDAERIMTSNSMKAIYYLGRYDYELNVSIVAETTTHADFGIDERTGGRAIGSARATRLVLDMPGKTLVVLEEKKLASPVGVPRDALELIENLCEVLALPGAAGVRAWQCGRSQRPAASASG